LPYEEEGEQIEENKLFAKREVYDIVPAGAGVLTCAVDVQEDRLECLVVGWGKDEEAWHIEHKILFGNTATEEVWQQLDAYLQKTFMHETGALLKIAICVIDAGYMTKKVYDFVKPRQTRRVYAIKGSQTAGAPIVGRPRTVGKQKVKLFMIGTTTAKDIIFSRLKLEKPGPGYMHFNMQCDEEYFLQLTAEKAVYRLIRGFAVKEYIKVRPRNEILDLWVYSLAAYVILNPNMDKILNELAQNQSKMVQNRAELALNQPETAQNQLKTVGNEQKPINNPNFRRCRTISWVRDW
jgi:phage terminase large subunit GpA-like protein